MNTNKLFVTIRWEWYVKSSYLGFIVQSACEHSPKACEHSPRHLGLEISLSCYWEVSVLVLLINESIIEIKTY